MALQVFKQVNINNKIIRTNVGIHTFNSKHLSFDLFQFILVIQRTLIKQINKFIIENIQ